MPAANCAQLVAIVETEEREQDVEKILRELKDKSDIQDHIHRYAIGIDLRKWDLFRSLFADEVDIDYSSYSGRPASKMSADDWVGACKAMLPGFDATQHQFSNFLIELDGDEAVATLYMQAEHFIANRDGDNSHTLGGYYTHNLRRVADGWEIYKAKYDVLWSRGNRHVYQLAAERVAQSKAK